MYVHYLNENENELNLSKDIVEASILYQPCVAESVSTLERIEKQKITPVFLRLLRARVGPASDWLKHDSGSIDVEPVFRMDH